MDYLSVITVTLSTVIVEPSKRTNTSPLRMSFALTQPLPNPVELPRDSLQSGT